MSYRAALIGLFLGFAGIVLWLSLAGVNPILAAAEMGIYLFIICMVMARGVIHELNTAHGLRLPTSPDYVTLGGLILERLGAVPQGGEELEVLPHHLTVLAVDARRISRVRVETRTG